MKKWMKILLGIVIFIVVSVAAGLYFTSGVVDVANAFLKAAKEKDFKKAHAYLSQEFKSVASEKALADYLTSSTLSNYKDASWSSREVSGGRGELVGTVTTDGGGSVPLKMVFVKENDVWKIYSLRKPDVGIQAENAPAAMPTKANQTALVKQSINDFFVSVNRKDMGHFRSTISNLWQKQFTTEQLNQAYKAVIDSGANWAALNNVEPVLSSEAIIDNNGVLVLTGFYPTTPSRVYFEQKYIYEGVAWKLIGFHIQVKRE